jgi:hypothetical protein
LIPFLREGLKWHPFLFAVAMQKADKKDTTKSLTLVGTPK